ncbi:e14 prophage; site-specific DNA recombinase [Hyphomicrobium sp. 1Nfss2.1]|uniref:recombinase family protein n=1 Tax=Hyphomicrobium sp. 1Nfss2.1 TaxID=3413936 RepID=UPI003C7AB909
MMIGYARVSTDEQNPALQFDALDLAGCKRIFTDYASGARTSRPSLDKVLCLAKRGDTLVVWKLDRLGRSLSHLITLISELEKRGVAFRSLSEAIDTGTAGGRLLFHVMGALAEFERALISERTRAGMAAAKTRGTALGRPRKLSSAQVSSASRSLARSRRSVRTIASKLAVSRSTLRRAVVRSLKRRVRGPI